MLWFLLSNSTVTFTTPLAPIREYRRSADLTERLKIESLKKVEECSLDNCSLFGIKEDFFKDPRLDDFNVKVQQKWTEILADNSTIPKKLQSIEKLAIKGQNSTQNLLKLSSIGLVQ